MKTYRMKHCLWCHSGFTPTSGRQLYCSNSHREKARWRHFIKTATPEQLAVRYAHSNRETAAGREKYNAHARAYQREWRKTRTPEQVERHRQQQRAWYERKKESAA